MVDLTDPRLARPLWRGRTNMDAMTIAVIERAESIKRERWPERPELHHQFDIIQGSYQDGAGDTNSAGMHDLGGGGDAAWCGHDECVLALRLAGAFAAHRTPTQGPWIHHIHFLVIEHPYLAAIAVRQIASYLAGRNGLKDNGPDDGPRLNPIPRPVWPWHQEDEVTPEDIDKIADRVVDKLLTRKIEVTRGTSKVKLKLEQVLRETFQRAGKG